MTYRPREAPPIEAHGVIGDRRTAALVAADGNVNWACLPWFNSTPVLGSLLHAPSGGHWRIGPQDAEADVGVQRFDGTSPVVHTEWEGPGWRLRLTDAMAFPETEREAAEVDSRVLVRRVTCLRGTVRVASSQHVVDDMVGAARVVAGGEAPAWLAGDRLVGTWTSHPVAAEGEVLRGEWELREGEEAWAVMSLGAHGRHYGLDAARSLLDATRRYWREWCAGVDPGDGERAEQLRLSAALVHLLTCAEAGSTVAAVTTSLPEQRGGGRNYDYRYSWVRDASLAADVLSRLGRTDEVEPYLDWLCRTLEQSEGGELGVVYQFDGKQRIEEVERRDVRGWGGSLPVRTGNAAWPQRQHDVAGFVVASATSFRDRGGSWSPRYSQLVAGVADGAARRWAEPDNGIWEARGERLHWTSGKVMSWVALVGASRLAASLGDPIPAAWTAAATAVRAAVLEDAWDPVVGSFRQVAERPGLDASVLLVALSGMLPATDPRIDSTIEALRDGLGIDGWLYRFDPRDADPSAPPPEEFEGAFLPSTFWLARVHVLRGELDEAEALLARAEACAPMGWFAEEVDPATGTFLGNAPLLLSQVEYARAVLSLDAARAAS